MVSISSSYKVVPSDPTPTGIFPLSLCDQIKLPTHGSILLVYTPTNTNTSPIDTLISSLSKTLVYFFPFSARLSFSHGGRLQLHCNAQGATLFEAKSDAKLQDLGDFESTHQIVQHLSPKFDYDSSKIEEIPLISAQLTRFSCGGLTLGIAICRVITDGAAVSGFMNSWAKLARGINLGVSDMPFLDRTLLDSMKLNGTEPRFDHVEFQPHPVWERKSEGKSEMGMAKAVILKLTRDQVQKLKLKVRDFETGQRGFTSFEAIAGHLWRCVSKVRFDFSNGDQKTRLATLVNCRNRLNPPLRSDFFGNATFPTVTQTCCFDDIVHKPLGFVVKKVREAIKKMNDEYVRSALDYIGNQVDLGVLRDTFHVSTVTPEGKFKGNPNFFLVGWTNFLFYDTDFGWGKPVFMGPGNLNSDGKAFVVNDGSSDGFVVAVCLQSYQVDALKKMFYEDIEEEVLPTSRL